MVFPFTAVEVTPVAGWSSLVARQAHNLKVAGSNPAPAPNFGNPVSLILTGFFVCGSGVREMGNAAKIWIMATGRQPITTIPWIGTNAEVGDVLFDAE